MLELVFEGGIVREQVEPPFFLGNDGLLWVVNNRRIQSLSEGGEVTQDLETTVENVESMTRSGDKIIVGGYDSSNENQGYFEIINLDGRGASEFTPPKINELSPYGMYDLVETNGRVFFYVRRFSHTPHYMYELVLNDSEREIRIHEIKYIQVMHIGKREYTEKVHAEKIVALRSDKAKNLYIVLDTGGDGNYHRIFRQSVECLGNHNAKQVGIGGLIESGKMFERQRVSLDVSRNIGAFSCISMNLEPMLGFVDYEKQKSSGISVGYSEVAFVDSGNASFFDGKTPLPSAISMNHVNGILRMAFLYDGSLYAFTLRNEAK